MGQNVVCFVCRIPSAFILTGVRLTMNDKYYIKWLQITANKIYGRLLIIIAQNEQLEANEWLPSWLKPIKNAVYVRCGSPPNTRG